MTSQYKFMCGCKYCISSKVVRSCLLTWHNHCMKYLKDRSQNAQNRRSGEIPSRIFETYNNALWHHCCQIYNNAADISMEKMCPCTSKHHGLPHCKCVLSWCDKFPIIVLHSKEANTDTTNTFPTIIFQVYRNVSWCTVHVQHQYHEWTTCTICSTALPNYTHEKNLCY